MCQTEKKPVRLLIFDLDGTLADTMYGIMDGVNMAMEKYNAPTHSYDAIRSFVGKGFRVLISRALPASMSEDENIIDEVVKCFEECYMITCNNRTECYEGMIDTLVELKNRGYTLAVLSNKKDTFVKPMVKAMVPEGIMSVAIGQRDEFPAKPDPTVPLMIARELGFTAEETAFIGDSDVDILTAKNAGMLSVGCSWGYREREVLSKSGVDLIVDKPTELLEIFG